MYVTLFMDVEDLVAPESDDAAADCARILSEEGVQATLCVVGEKARLLKQRGRTDVIEAMRKHDIGFHTDLHSVPPTIAAYLAPLDWENGVREATEREGPGVRSIQDVFGMHASCWGGPGNTWGPQVCGAMQALDIPAFVYAYTEVPGGGAHHFAGRRAYPNGRHFNDGAYQDVDAARAGRERVAAELRADAGVGVFWQEAFLGHPTRLLHEEFWDAPNFSNGERTPKDRWVQARRKSQADYEQALASFRLAIQAVRDVEGVEIRTIRQMNAILDPAPVARLTEAECEVVWPEIKQRILGMGGWPILPRDFDARGLAALTHERLGTLERLAPAA